MSRVRYIAGHPGTIINASHQGAGVKAQGSPLTHRRDFVRWTLSPPPMDIWVDGDIWPQVASAESEKPFNVVSFGLCCACGSIIAGELLYLLIKTARYGRHFAFFNFVIAILGCLIVQFFTLAIAMWLAYVPNYPVCIARYISFCYFRSSGC